MNISLSIVGFIIAGAIKFLSTLTANDLLHKRDDLGITTGILAGVENKWVLIRPRHQEIDEVIDNRFLHLFGFTPFFMCCFPQTYPLKSLERSRYSTLENSSDALTAVLLQQPPLVGSTCF